jgi:hypothetical protein
MRVDRLIFLLVLIGCKATVSTSSTSEIYNEDLGYLRPELKPLNEEEPTLEDSIVKVETFTPMEGHIKAELDSINKISYQQNIEGRLVDGYVFQIYSSTNRDEATQMKKKFDSLYPELNAKLSYKQPSFIVKAGRFIDRLEANQVFLTIKQDFPKALIIPERFNLTYE